MKKLIDKLCAIWVILTCNEFIVFTAKTLDNPKGVKCWCSVGIENKEKSDVFRRTISDFILEL